LLGTLILTALALVAAGCGGDDDESSAKTETSKTTAETAARTEARTATEKADAKTSTERDAGGSANDASGDQAGDAGGDSGGGGNISRAQFVRRADTICRSTQRRLLREVRPNAKAPADVSTYTTTVTRGFLKAADEIDALPEPSSGPSPAAFLAAERTKMKLIGELGNALKGKDAQELQRVAARAQRAASRSAKLGREQGFKVCGQS
jgi:hypothetical protein